MSSKEALAQTPTVNLPAPEEFVEGRRVVHADGTTVSFDENRWILQLAQGTHAQLSVNFTTIPSWMRHYAKRLVAREWLLAGKSTGGLTQIATALRHVSRAIPAFKGPSVGQLTPDHAGQIHDYLLARFQAMQDAIAEGKKKKGRQLAPREEREVVSAAGGLGRVSIAKIVGHFNQLLLIARQEGVELDFELAKPRGVTQAKNRVGGADPQKIVSDDEVAAIIDATQQDIDEYLAARKILSTLEAEINRHDNVKDASRIYRRLDRYLGIEGGEPISLKRIAQEEGLASLPGRALLPWLERAVGVQKANEVWSHRSKLPERGVAVSPDERAYARQALASMVAELDFSLLKTAGTAKYSAALQLAYGLNGYRIHSLEDAGKMTNVTAAALSEALRLRRTYPPTVDHELFVQLLPAREAALRTHSRAIKACALQLLAVTARRVSALLVSLKAEPDTEWIEHGGQRLYCIRFQSYKVWGDEGLPERVELPGFYGVVAERAIQTAQELTRPLRREAGPDAEDQLFIIHNHFGARNRVRTLKEQALHSYVHNHRGNGVLVRRGVPRATELTIHWFRHRTGTEMTSLTGDPRYAARFLGNEPAQAATAYCSMGTPEARARTRQLVGRGAASGTLFDAAARLKMEADGAVDDRLPASQLSVEEATSRLKRNPTFLADYIQGDEDVTPEAVARFLEGGFTINLTSRGGCILPAAEGPCPASEECPIGCDPDASEIEPGCGCRWQVLVPHDDAITTLRSDLETLRQQRCHFEKVPGYQVWLEHLDRRIEIWDTQLQRMLALRKNADDLS